MASCPVTGIIASHYHIFENNPSALCPKDFLTHFTTSYPLPQQRPCWLNVQPPSSGLWSNMISMLRGQRLELRRWTMKCEELGGITGPPMHSREVALTLGCAPSPSPKNKPTCLPLPPGFELESLGEWSKLDTNLWKKPSVTSHKTSSWPDSRSPTQPRGQRARPTILPLAVQLQDRGSSTTTAGCAPCQRSRVRRRILLSTQRSYKGGCGIPNHDCVLLITSRGRVYNNAEAQRMHAHGTVPRS